MNEFKYYEASYRSKNTGEILNTTLGAKSIVEAKEASSRVLKYFHGIKDDSMELLSINEIPDPQEERPSTAMGIVRTMDDLGRVVIPKEIRQSVGIKEGADLNIMFKGRNIILTPVNESPLDDVELSISKLKGYSILRQNLEKVIEEYKRKNY